MQFMHMLAGLGGTATPHRQQRMLCAGSTLVMRLMRDVVLMRELVLLGAFRTFVVVAVVGCCCCIVVDVVVSSVIDYNLVF